MRKLLGAIALAALAAATVHADPGGGKGNGGGGNGGGGKDHGAAEARGQGGGMADHGQGKAARADHGNGGFGDHGKNENVNRPAKAGGNDRADRGQTVNHRAMPTQANKQGRANQHQADSDHSNVGRDNDKNAPHTAWRELDRRGLVNGCPPGLAKKNNGCMPPGQAKQSGYDQYDANWWGLRGLNNLSGFRYIDGNLVRLAPGGAVMDYYPLLGGALAVGNPWPSAWQPTPLSPYYSNYYGLGDDYRYFDGAIYRVEPSTSAIQSVAALLTGDNFTVGQRIPAGYDAYNVPYQYRDRYADGPDANYRYSDGYVYKTDPKTQLILAAIQLLS